MIYSLVPKTDTSEAPHRRNREKREAEIKHRIEKVLEPLAAKIAAAFPQVKVCEINALGLSLDIAEPNHSETARQIEQAFGCSLMRADNPVHLID